MPFPKFNPEFTWGHVMTAAASIISVIGLYVSMRVELGAHDSRIRYIEQNIPKIEIIANNQIGQDARLKTVEGLAIESRIRDQQILERLTQIREDIATLKARQK